MYTCTYTSCGNFYKDRDQLTAARVRGSKQVKSNSERRCDQLNGLQPVTEDWHAKG